jgi:hypothetical protein
MGGEAQEFECQGRKVVKKIKEKKPAAKSTENKRSNWTNLGTKSFIHVQVLEPQIGESLDNEGF